MLLPKPRIGYLRRNLYPNTDGTLNPHMIIKPKIRGFICTTTHPVGCEANVREQIAYTQAQGKIESGPKRALIIGSSSGYGLSSRIAAAFGSGRRNHRGVF